MVIPIKTTTLAGVPEALHDFYHEANGMHVLGVSYPAEHQQVQKHRDRWRTIAEQGLIADKAAAVVERLGVDEMWRATVQRAVAARLRVALDLDDAHSLPEVIVVDEKGQQASLPDGRTLTPDLIGAEVDGEFHAEYSVTWKGAQKAGSGKPDAQPIDDGRDVRLPPGYSQRQFEAAFARAMADGVDLVFEEGAPAPGPSARDVVLPRDHTQAQFERAFHQAAAQGGDVFYEGDI